MKPEERLYAPGYGGKNCTFNGLNIDAQGIIIESMCDDCKYFLCCHDGYNDCRHCTSMCPITKTKEAEE